MRTLLGIVLVVACARVDIKPTASAAALKYTGTWDGRSYRSPSDTGVPWRVVMTLVADGTIRGTLTYPGTTAPPVAIRVREFSDTSLVQELGPYHSRVSDAEVMTRAVGRASGDSLHGTFEMRAPDGGAVIMSGTYRAKRVS